MMKLTTALLALPLIVSGQNNGQYGQYGNNYNSNYGSTNTGGNQLGFLYDESAGTACNNGFAITDVFVGCAITGQQGQAGGMMGTECHMGDAMTISGKITSTQSGIPLNAAVRFHACNTGWTRFFQTTCVLLGEKFINTCTQMYGMNAISNSVCADVGTYEFFANFNIPKYDNELHSGKRLEITTEFDFKNTLLTQCTSYVDTIESTRRATSGQFGWSMGAVAVAAVAMALYAKKRRLATAEGTKGEALVSEKAVPAQSIFVELPDRGATV